MSFSMLILSLQHVGYENFVTVLKDGPASPAIFSNEGYKENPLQAILLCWQDARNTVDH